MEYSMPGPGDMAMVVVGGGYSGRVVYCSRLLCDGCGHCAFCREDRITVDADWIPRELYSTSGIPPAARRSYLMKLGPSGDAGAALHRKLEGIRLRIDALKVLTRLS